MATLHYCGNRACTCMHVATVVTFTSIWQYYTTYIFRATVFLLIICNTLAFLTHLHEHNYFIWRKQYWSVQASNLCHMFLLYQYSLYSDRPTATCSATAYHQQGSRGLQQSLQKVILYHGFLNSNSIKLYFFHLSIKVSNEKETELKKCTNQYMTSLLSYVQFHLSFTYSLYI